MRKLALLAPLAAALAVPGIAVAATPQGQLTGSATHVGGTHAVTTTIVDGGTSYVGAGNDLSGTCEGDSGAFIVNDAGPFNVVCAHYVASSGCCNAGSPKMRFAVQELFGYAVVRITDNGASGDTLAYTGSIVDFATAQSQVNKGLGGSGGLSWNYVSLSSGGFTVTP